LSEQRSKTMPQSLREIWDERCAAKHPEIKVLSNVAEANLAADVIATSFAGTTSTAPEGTNDWFLGSEFRDGGSMYGPLKAPPLRERIRVLRWISGLVALKSCFLNGLIICVQNKEKEVTGCVIVEDHRKKRSGVSELFATLYIVLLHLGLPWWLLNSDLRARGKAVLKCMEFLHKNFMPMPHIYVIMVATHPDFQGKGVCSKLMKACNALSDACGVPCYLESSGTKNHNVYASKGYQTVFVLNKILVPQRLDLKPYAHKGGFAGMVRNPT